MVSQLCKQCVQLTRLLDVLPYHLLLCGGCTYYCSVKLVAVIGDSGLCLFYQWVWSEGGLMFLP